MATPSDNHNFTKQKWTRNLHYILLHKTIILLIYNFWKIVCHLKKC